MNETNRKKNKNGSVNKGNGNGNLYATTTAQNHGHGHNVNHMNSINLSSFHSINNNPLGQTFSNQNCIDNFVNSEGP